MQNYRFDLFSFEQKFQNYLVFIFCILKEKTTIMTRAPVVVKSHYVEIRIRRYICKSGPRSPAALRKSRKVMKSITKLRCN